MKNFYSNKYLTLLPVYALSTLIAYVLVIPLGANGVLGFNALGYTSETLMRMATVFVGCYIGMIAANFYGRASSSSSERAIDFRSSIISAMIAPIVAATVYSNSESISTPIALLFVSFQNGFFWQSVLSKNV